MKNLISMVDFVLELDTKEHWAEDFKKCVNYANFLKQPLELWMFIACYLRNGSWIPYTKDTLLNNIYLFNEWKQAKNNILFEGFELVSEFENQGCFSLSYNNDKRIFSLDDKIENLLEYKGIEFKLTKPVIKQLEL